MQIWFCAATGGFYDERISTPPARSVAVSLDAYRGLLRAQESGASIVAGKDGFPVALAPAAPAHSNAAVVAPAVVSVADRLASLEQRQAVILQHLGLHL